MAISWFSFGRYLFFLTLAIKIVNLWKRKGKKEIDDGALTNLYDRILIDFGGYLFLILVI